MAEDTVINPEETKAIIPVKSPLFQACANHLYQILVETEASQVKTADGLNVEVRLNTIERALAGNTTMHLAANIADRDALQGLIVGDKVYVDDATGDDTVDKGGAMYLWQANGTFKKLSEDESLDLVIKWAMIEGKPESDPASIDLAVAKQHIHENKTTLDKLSDDGTGNLLFEGKRIQDPYVDVAVVADITEIPLNLRDGGLIIVNPAAPAQVANAPAFSE